MKTGIGFFKVVLGLIPSVVLILILFSQFPNIGLARIISIPLILMINILVIVLGLAFSLRFGQRYLFVKLGCIILLTLFITLLLYPQEHDPNIIVQLWDKIVITKFRINYL